MHRPNSHMSARLAESRTEIRSVRVCAPPRGRDASYLGGSESGATLVELMIVVMVIAVMAGAFGTSVRRTVIEQRSAGAAREIVRMVRDARLSARVLRVAHAVVVNPTTGVVRTLRAATNSCLATSWPTLETQCAAASAEQRAMGTECVSVDFTSTPWSFPGSPTFRLRELVLAGTTPPGDDTLSDLVRTICFSPNGTVFHATGTDPLTDRNQTSGGGTLGGGFMFQIDMIRPGESAPSPDFVPRQLLVTLNGLAKVVR